MHSCLLSFFRHCGRGIVYCCMLGQSDTFNSSHLPISVFLKSEIFQHLYRGHRTEQKYLRKVCYKVDYFCVNGQLTVDGLFVFNDP
jgi:hypothetical protein